MVHTLILTDKNAVFRLALYPPLRPSAAVRVCIMCVHMHTFVFVYVTFMPIYRRVTQDAQTDERLGEEEENERVERVYGCVCDFCVRVCECRKERYKMKGLERLE